MSTRYDEQGTLDGTIETELDTACDQLLSRPTTKSLLNDNNSPDGPIALDRVTYPGLISTIRKKFYPGYEKVERHSGTSSIDTGIRVHRQLYHSIECTKQCNCQVKTNMKRLNAMTLNALRKFEELHFTPVAAEVPILCKVWNVGTRLDVVGYLWKGTPRQTSCVVSIKTGYSSGRNRSRGDYLMKPLDRVKSNEQNHNQLQSLCEHCILRFEYELIFKRYFIIYLHKEYEQVEVEEPAEWWGDNKMKRSVFDHLSINRMK
jgi:hypothetical protein